MTLNRNKYTNEQWKWCENYQFWTDYEPQMEEFENGSMTFVKAAQFAAAWYESHTSDAYLKLCNIPGAVEEMMKEICHD